MNSFVPGLSVFRKRRRILLGKYADLVDKHDFKSGIFRFLKNNPKTRYEIVNQVAIFESLKVYCWGNHKLGICGVGKPFRNIYKKPEEVIFPEGERIWYITHSHEYLTGAISLSGKCYSWGNDSPFSVKDKEISGCPVEGVEFNLTLQKMNETAIDICGGHSFLVVLTHTGKVYLCMPGKIKRIEIKQKVEHICCTSFALHFHVGNKDDDGGDCSVGTYDVWEENVEYRKICMKKGEKVLRIDAGYNGWVVITNIRIVDPSAALLSTGSVNDVVDHSAAYSHFLVTRDGSLYGKGTNNHGEMSVVDHGKCITPGFGLITFPKLENVRVIAVSNGTDFHTHGGHTLFMDHNHTLYHMGNNRCGEHLEDPTMKKKDHFPPKRIPLENVLVFNANENYCSVICYAKRVLTHFRMNLVVARELGVQCDVGILTKF